jgi:hypothetical protein
MRLKIANEFTMSKIVLDMVVVAAVIDEIANFDRDFDKIDWLTRIDAPANVPSHSLQIGGWKSVVTPKTWTQI